MAETKARFLANLIEDDGDVKSAHLDNVDALPTQTSHSGKFLTTDGSSASWGTVSVTPTAVSDQANTSTGYLDVPAGTDAERPGSPNVGQIRYNSTRGELEIYKGSAWVKVKTITYDNDVHFLVVAGGGNTLSGNATNNPGAGGAGGLRSSYTATGGGGSVESAVTCTLGTNYTVTVGGGQSNSVFATVTSSAGGQGGAMNGAGSSGGSGGGGGTHGSNAGGAGTAGQGYAGGSGAEGGSYGAGGGGGAGGAGQNGTTAGSRSGDGGLALANNITGTSTYYAGGGGGGKQGGYHGWGGGTSTSSQKGGGGNGSSSQNGAEGGGANTGGGAGSNGQIGQMDAESGGSGIVILRFPNIFNITVGAGLTSTNTTDGTDKVYTFTNGTGNISFTSA